MELLIDAQENKEPLIESTIIESNNKTDDLTIITGIGAAVQVKLNNIGIRKYTDLANASTDTIEAINKILPHKLTRDNWIEQAQKIISAT